jgi:hypothetical protein
VSCWRTSNAKIKLKEKKKKKKEEHGKTHMT